MNLKAIRMKMKQTGETIPATGGSAACQPQPVRRRNCAWSGLVLTALLGSILVIWVSRTTWERVDHLQTRVRRVEGQRISIWPFT